MVQKLLKGECNSKFVFRDLSGKEQTYGSVEEMPPEVRSLFDQIRRLGGVGAIRTIQTTPPPGS